MKPVYVALLSQAVITAAILLLVWHLEPTKLRVFAAELFGWGLAAWVLAGLAWLLGWQGMLASQLVALLVLHRSSTGAKKD